MGFMIELIRHSKMDIANPNYSPEVRYYIFKYWHHNVFCKKHNYSTSRFWLSEYREWPLAMEEENEPKIWFTLGFITTEEYGDENYWTFIK